MHRLEAGLYYDFDNQMATFHLLVVSLDLNMDRAH